MKTKLILVLSVLSLGCAQGLSQSPPNRAAVVMKVSEIEGHVCMGAGEVAPGGRVALYKNECRRPARVGKSVPPISCEKIKVGEGRVTRIINEHYSVIQVEPGVAFDEGTIVFLLSQLAES